MFYCFFDIAALLNFAETFVSFPQIINFKSIDIMSDDACREKRCKKFAAKDVGKIFKQSFSNLLK